MKVRMCHQRQAHHVKRKDGYQRQAQVVTMNEVTTRELMGVLKPVANMTVLMQDMITL